MAGGSRAWSVWWPLASAEVGGAAALQKVHPQQPKGPQDPWGPAKPRARSVVLATRAARTPECLWVWALGSLRGRCCPWSTVPSATTSHHHRAAGALGSSLHPDTVCQGPQACSQHSATSDLRSVSAPSLPTPEAGSQSLGSGPIGLCPHSSAASDNSLPLSEPPALTSAGPFLPSRLEPALVGYTPC